MDTTEALTRSLSAATLTHPPGPLADWADAPLCPKSPSAAAVTTAQECWRSRPGDGAELCQDLRELRQAGIGHLSPSELAPEAGSSGGSLELASVPARGAEGKSGLNYCLQCKFLLCPGQWPTPQTHGLLSAGSEFILGIDPHLTHEC